MRVLHVIHDFLPRHRAGSEIYADELCQALLASGEDVWLMATDYDLGRDHGTLVWRTWRDLPVVELINNWVFSDFEETWRSPLVAEQFENVLEALAPDVVHIHNMLNLSFELPEICRRRGIATVATLHDYTLFCPSGGQRVHQAELHICREIDVERCRRCFMEHNFHGRLVYGSLGLPGARQASQPGPVRRRMRAAAAVGSRLASRVPGGPRISTGAMRKRFEAAQEVLSAVDLWVAPSEALGDEYRALGMPDDRLEVADYGFVTEPFEGLPGELARERNKSEEGRLRIGFVGTLVWHKGAHILLEALGLLAERVGPEAFEAHIWGAFETFPDYTARLRSEGEGLPGNLRGGFDGSRVREVYSSFDVLVVASLWPENSPLVIHEAFMAGVPVVGADMGGIPGLVEHEVGGLLYDAFSALELADQLERLVNEPRLLEQLRAGVPAVKTIADDARDWQVRYAGVCKAGSREPAEEPAAGGTAAVVLNYRTPDETVMAVRALAREDSPLERIVVVENHSEEASLEQLERRLGPLLSATTRRRPAVELVVNDDNLGFSGGCNVGIRRALDEGADSVLLVNPDLVIEPRAIVALREALFPRPGDQALQPGIAAPVLRSRSDPRMVISTGLGYGPVLGRMRHLDYGTPAARLPSFGLRIVDGAAGCALLVRAEVFESAGLLDEEFFFSFEDLEFCLRARKNGWSTVTVGDAHALHQGSVSLPANDPLRFRYAARNHLLLAKKHAGGRRLPLFRRWSIVALNRAHAFLAGGVRRREMAEAVRAGIEDFDAGRSGGIETS